jgi:hypothetical protein
MFFKKMAVCDHLGFSIDPIFICYYSLSQANLLTKFQKKPSMFAEPRAKTNLQNVLKHVKKILNKSSFFSFKMGFFVDFIFISLLTVARTTMHTKLKRKFCPCLQNPNVHCFHAKIVFCGHCVTANKP